MAEEIEEKELPLYLTKDLANSLMILLLDAKGSYGERLNHLLYLQSNPKEIPGQFAEDALAPSIDLIRAILKERDTLELELSDVIVEFMENEDKPKSPIILKPTWKGTS